MTNVRKARVAAHPMVTAWAKRSHSLRGSDGLSVCRVDDVLIFEISVGGKNEGQCPHRASEQLA